MNLHANSNSLGFLKTIIGSLLSTSNTVLYNNKYFI